MFSQVKSIRQLISSKDFTTSRTNSNSWRIPVPIPKFNAKYNYFMLSSMVNEYLYSYMLLIEICIHTYK